MSLKLLLVAGIITCKCRFVFETYYNGYREWYYDPSKVSLESIPDEWLFAEVIEIAPRDGMFDIYVK